MTPPIEAAERLLKAGVGGLADPEDLRLVCEAVRDNSDFMAFMHLHFADWPCCCEPGAHADTPPMFWPELIACIVQRAVQDATRDMPRWRDIESAPKEYPPELSITGHGPMILGCGPDMSITVIRFNHPWTMYEGTEREIRHEGGWQDCGEGFEQNPTHWMPLPAMPVHGPIPASDGEQA